MADPKVTGEIIAINDKSVAIQIKQTETESEEGTPISLIKNNKIQENGNDLLPKGAIIMWSDANVPAGWNICNGQNGTPDLRGRFILGASEDSDNPENVPIKEALNKAGVGKAFINSKKNIPSSGLFIGKEEYIYDIDRVCPPYYALYYIMKL